MVIGMKDYVSTLLQDSSSLIQSRNIVREYLQARILGSLQRSGAMIPLAFHGGTALRFLYTLPRHSEDLDFALESAHDLYDFHSYLRNVVSEFAKENYTIELKINTEGVVHSAFIRFVGLLFELGISPHQSELLSVKVEVDTNAPKGSILETTVVRKYVILQLHHHDRASLLAGKIHAVLQRSYSKGRDFYDLLWYLSAPNWPTPNLDLLNNALRQTNWGGPALLEDNWRKILRDRIKEANWGRIQTDVFPFIEDENALQLLTKENLLGLLD
jgi:hypothetical protein